MDDKKGGTLSFPLCLLRVTGYNFVMEVLRLNGPSAQNYLQQLAELRLTVFWEYPYLYEGDIEYEKRYLSTYFKCPDSFILLLKDKDKIVGATTAIVAEAEEENFRQAFLSKGLKPSEGVYFGESVLLAEYRGKGWGKLFFQEREKFARDLGRNWVSFCSVVRQNHPLEPVGYQGHGNMWKHLGYEVMEGMTTYYEWKDRDQADSTKKLMQYWFKNLS